MIRARPLGKACSSFGLCLPPATRQTPVTSEQLQEEQGKPALGEGLREGLQEDWPDGRLEEGRSGQTAECADAETQGGFCGVQLG